MATTNDTKARDQYNEVTLCTERAAALGKAIQQACEDGDEHASLFTLLDQQLDAIDRIMETNRQWGGYQPIERANQDREAPRETNIEHAIRAIDRAATGEQPDAPPIPLSLDATVDQARSDAQMLGYDVRFLVEAARTLNTNGADDGPLEQVLKAAEAKLAELTEALDSERFGKVRAVQGGAS